jgi:hypothetical protein
VADTRGMYGFVNSIEPFSAAYVQSHLNRFGPHVVHTSTRRQLSNRKLASSRNYYSVDSLARDTPISGESTYYNYGSHIVSRTTFSVPISLAVSTFSTEPPTAFQASTGVVFSTSTIVAVTTDVGNSFESGKVFAIPTGTTLIIDKNVTALTFFSSLYDSLSVKLSDSYDVSSLRGTVRYLFDKYPVEMVFFFCIPCTLIFGFGITIFTMIALFIFRRCFPRFSGFSRSSYSSVSSSAKPATKPSSSISFKTGSAGQRYKNAARSLFKIE